MPSKMELLLEADKRGILPPDKKALFEEAKRRGLVGGVNEPISETNADTLPGAILEQDYPVRRAISSAARSTLEGAGLLGGGVLGGTGGTFLGGPVVGTAAGAVGGAGLLYAAGSNAADRLEEFLGLVKKHGLKESSIKAISDLERGAMLEMGGGVTGKVLTVAGKGIWSIAKNAGLLDFFKAIKNLFPNIGNDAILKQAQEALKVLREETPILKQTSETTEELFKRTGIKTKPTFAQKTGSIKAGYFEQSSASKNRELADILKQQDAKINQEALENIGEKFPTKGSVVDVLRGVESKKAELAEKAKQAVGLVEQKTAQLANVKDPQAAGQIIKETLETAKKAEKSAIDALYKEIPQGIELSAEPINKAIAETFSDFKKIGGGAQTLPSAIIKQMTSSLKSTNGKAVTMEQLRDWRSQIGEEIRESMMGANPNLKLTRRLKKLGDGVDEALDQMLKLSEEHASTIELYRTASERFKEYAATFRRGSVGDVLQQGQKSSMGKIDFSDIPSRFFRTGKMDSADELIRAVGKDKATNLIDDYAGYDLLSRTKGASTINTSSAKEWLFKNKEILNKYGLYNKYSEIVKTGEGMELALGELNAYEKSSAGRVLGTNIDAVMQKVFGGVNKSTSASVAKDLMNMPGIKGNVMATNGIKNGFKDFFMSVIQTSKKDALGNEISSIAKTKNFLRDYGPAMKEIYKDTPEQITALQDYHKILEVLERNKNITFAGGSTTAEKLAGAKQEITSGIAKNIAQFIAVERGAGWKFSVFRNLWKSFTSGPRKFSEEQIDALLTEAIYNPEVAKTIMEATKPFGKSTKITVMVKDGGKYIAKQIPALDIQNKYKKHLLTMGAYAIDRRLNISKDELREE